MFDVRIFHPNAPSVRTVPVNSLYVRHEKEKRWRYEQRVKDVEGATVVPLVFSTAGGMGRSSSVIFKRSPVGGEDWKKLQWNQAKM